MSAHVQEILPVLQLILATGNICILGYALVKFLNKPHSNLETRVSTLEIEVRETKQSLLQGNDRFRDQDDKFKEQEKTNSVLIHSVLALIEFEIQYCLTEHKDMTKGLEKAKEDLNEYLSRK